MFGVARHAAYMQESVFEVAASEVVLELVLDILWQRCAVRGHPVGERRVLRVDELVQERGFRAMAFLPNNAMIASLCCGGLGAG